MARPAAAPRRGRRRAIETVVRDRQLVAQRHEQIFRAASRIFVSRGFHQATVREIAEEAGLSLGSLYSYIRTKDDILYLVFEKLSATLRENIHEAIRGIDDPVAQITAALRAGLATTEQYQNEILLLYQETKCLDAGSRRAVLRREADYVTFFEDILRSGFERGNFKGDPRLAADIITYLCSIVALRRWHLSRFKRVEIEEGLVQFILRALGASS